MGEYLSRIIDLSEVSENYTSLIYTREKNLKCMG